MFEWMIKWMNRSERQISLVPSIQKQKQAVFFQLTKSLSSEMLCNTNGGHTSKERAGDAQSDKESSPALLPFNHSPPYTYHIPSRALLSNPKDSSSHSNNLSSLTITTGEQRDRKVLQDKWRGSNFWGLSFKRGGEEGCVPREWKSGLPPRCPIRPIFCKTRCAPFAY